MCFSVKKKYWFKWLLVGICLYRGWYAVVQLHLALGRPILLEWGCNTSILVRRLCASKGIPLFEAISRVLQRVILPHSKACQQVWHFGLNMYLQDFSLRNHYNYTVNLWAKQSNWRPYTTWTVRTCILLPQWFVHLDSVTLMIYLIGEFGVHSVS